MSLFYKPRGVSYVSEPRHVQTSNQPRSAGLVAIGNFGKRLLPQHQKARLSRRGRTKIFLGFLVRPACRQAGVSVSKPKEALAFRSGRLHFNPFSNSISLAISLDSFSRREITSLKSGIGVGVGVGVGLIVGVGVGVGVGITGPPVMVKVPSL